MEYTQTHKTDFIYSIICDLISVFTKKKNNKRNIIRGCLELMYG